MRLRSPSTVITIQFQVNVKLASKKYHLPISLLHLQRINVDLSRTNHKCNLTPLKLWLEQQNNTQILQFTFGENILQGIFNLYHSDNSGDFLMALKNIKHSLQSLVLEANPNRKSRYSWESFTSFNNGPNLLSDVHYSGLSPIEEFSQLTQLEIFNTYLTSQDLASICKLTTLESLSIEPSDNLLPLCSLTSLKCLKICGERLDIRSFVRSVLPHWKENNCLHLSSFSLTGIELTFANVNNRMYCTSRILENDSFLYWTQSDNIAP